MALIDPIWSVKPQSLENTKVVIFWPIRTTLSENMGRGSTGVMIMYCWLYVVCCFCTTVNTRLTHVRILFCPLLDISSILKFSSVCWTIWFFLLILSLRWNRAASIPCKMLYWCFAIHAIYSTQCNVKCGCVGNAFSLYASYDILWIQRAVFNFVLYTRY